MLVIKILLVLVSIWTSWSQANDELSHRMAASGGGLFSGLQSSSQSSSSSQSRIQFELYKALVGETVRLECPQPNPTWFFRKASSPASNQEDLIVTRHGVVNVDYKYKIMSHLSPKHKVIIINNVEFDDEGLYTCLYTLPLAGSMLGTDPDSDFMMGSAPIASSVQYRHVFNVSVYSNI